MDQISRTCSAAPPIVDKILRKTKPADIPDKAAAEFRPYKKALGATVPPTLLALANEVNRAPAVSEASSASCNRLHFA